MLFDGRDLANDALVREVAWAPPPLPSTGPVEVAPIRGCLETRGDVSAVILAATGDALAMFGSVGSTSAPRRLWELPGTTGQADDGGAVSEVVSLRIRSAHGEAARAIRLRGLPRPRPAPEGDEERSSSSWEQAAELVEAMVARHVETIYELADLPPPLDSLMWRRGGRRLVCTLSDLVRQWRQVAAEHEPRHALIVRLAKELRELLPDVCRRPRLMLRRDRQMQPVHRVQQLDATCLRWLARQPGLTVAERAGPRQMVMAVVRVDQADTHENRVVKDLVVRCQRAARLYLREHRSFGAHDRIDAVRGFGQRLRVTMRDTPLQAVGGLVGVPAPNYVLQHDERYAPLWRAYLELLRQQTTLDAAWRWRARVWGETCTLATLAALQELSPEAVETRSDVHLHLEHTAGHFIDPRTEAGPFRVTRGSVIDVLLGPSQVARYPRSQVQQIAGLGPDVVLAVRPDDRRAPSRVVGVWSLLDFALDPGLERMVELLDEALPATIARAVVIVPAPLSAGARCEVVGRCSIVRLAVPPQAGVPALATVLREALQTELRLPA